MLSIVSSGCIPGRQTVKQNLHIEFFLGGCAVSINITDDSADPVRSAEDCPIVTKEA